MLALVVDLLTHVIFVLGLIISALGTNPFGVMVMRISSGIGVAVGTFVVATAEVVAVLGVIDCIIEYILKLTPFAHQMSRRMTTRRRLTRTSFFTK